MTARAQIESFHDAATGTFSHLVRDPATGDCALIDTVLDYDAAAGRTAPRSAQRLLDRVTALGARVQWLLETHVHADHLSAAAWLQQQAGGRIGIGEHIVTVQRTFGRLFHAEAAFVPDGRAFDQRFADGEVFHIGRLPVRVLHTPGHTPACVSYLLEEDSDAPAVFVGDTLFRPDYGSARCDFPGGDARQLHRSVRRLLALPPATRLFHCHDYPADGQAPQVSSTVAAQRSGNIHLHEGIDADAFAALRQGRDATLSMPALMLPSVQVNMRAGHLPPAEDNGVAYLKIPLNQL